MKTVAILLITLFVAMVGLVSAAKDPKACEVCIKVVNTVRDRVPKSDRKDKHAYETTLASYCDGAAKESRERKMCYYLQPVQREVSRPLSIGAPAERICKKLAKATPEVCELRFPEKLDLSKLDLKKLRVKQLRKILSEYGLTCDGCVEKSDYVRKVQSLVESEL